MRIAVVGQGSIGKRHTKNLEDLGHRVIPIDIGNKLNFDCDYVFICTPTELHTEQAYEYLIRGIPTFIEKPLTYSLEDLRRFAKSLEGKKIISMVGCNMRFHPAIRAAKDLVEKHKPLFARAEYGYYLPFWKKGDYKKSYSASEFGGIILDDIHELDYMCWLFGTIKDIKTVSAKVSDLEIKKEDIAETAILFDNGITGSIHSDYLMKNQHRTLAIQFAHKSVTFKIEPTNLMYKKEVEHFLDLAFSRIQPMNGVFEAAYVLEKMFEGRGNNSSPKN